FLLSFSIFFFHDPPPPDLYTLSLHDALPICLGLDPLGGQGFHPDRPDAVRARRDHPLPRRRHLDLPLHGDAPPRERVVTASTDRSEEHTSELQSRGHLVCRLLLEKKKKTQNT